MDKHTAATGRCAVTRNNQPIQVCRYLLKKQTDKEGERKNESEKITPDIIKENAKRIINAARDQANQHKKKAEDELSNLKKEIEKIKREKRKIIEKIKVSAQESLAEQEKRK